MAQLKYENKIVRLDSGYFPNLYSFTCTLRALSQFKYAVIIRMDEPFGFMSISRLKGTKKIRSDIRVERRKLVTLINPKNKGTSSNMNFGKFMSRSTRINTTASGRSSERRLITPAIRKTEFSDLNPQS